MGSTLKSVSALSLKTCLWRATCLFLCLRLVYKWVLFVLSKCYLLAYFWTKQLSNQNDFYQTCLYGLRCNCTSIGLLLFQEAFYPKKSSSTFLHLWHCCLVWDHLISGTLYKVHVFRLGSVESLLSSGTEGQWYFNIFMITK